MLRTRLTFVRLMPLALLAALLAAPAVAQAPTSVKAASVKALEEAPADRDAAGLSAQPAAMEAVDWYGRPLLRLAPEGGFVLLGEYGYLHDIPVEGRGTRLMWYPGKAAFRAGNVTGDQWDRLQVGDYSTALGVSPRASNYAATALGSGTATGSTSTALGGAEASGQVATAMGRGTLANGALATAMGTGTTARGTASVALGGGTEAFGPYAFASGIAPKANGQGSIATGNFSEAPSMGSTAMGNVSKAYNTYAVAIGDGAEALAPHAFAVGNRTKASGSASIAMGAHTEASGQYAFASGYASKASRRASIAMGSYAEAGLDYAIALGREAQATGLNSVAMGHETKASGYYSATAMGSGTLASGYNATAMGLNTTAQAYASLAIGRFNTLAGNPTAWSGTDPLFVAGNGASATQRSNALTLYKNGNLTIAGSLTQSSDARLKQDVAPLTGALEALAALQPVRYRFRAGTGRPPEAQVGLLAQEVEAVLPELVRAEADGYLSVSYTQLAAVLVQAVNEQQAQIEALRAEVAALQSSPSRPLAGAGALGLLGFLGRGLLGGLGLARRHAAT